MTNRFKRLKKRMASGDKKAQKQFLKLMKYKYGKHKSTDPKPLTVDGVVFTN